jgi:potassium efflux system protein
MLETLTTAFFFSRIFPAVRSSVKKSQTNNSPNMSQWLYVNLRFILIMIIPLLLVALSIYGYHYSAVQLEKHMVNSALVILAGLLCFSILLRAFEINERQLALEKLRAKRSATIAAKKQSEDDDAQNENSAPTLVDLQEIDLQSISKQTKALLKLVFSVIVALALWSVWAEIFPAFKPLVNIEMWSVQETNDGITKTVSVTLWNLLLSIATITITYLATRNISGLLDVALLSRLSLKPGSSYAIATTAQYAIVIIGSVIALQGLGAQWSKLQWLIAALSVGLGFGLQEIVANFFSGIVILFERPFRIGDTVTVGEQWGTVTKIRMRATTIIDWDRREMIVPNKTFIQERLTNWTLTDAITRRKINVGVAYGSDVELVERLLLKIAADNNKVLDDPAPEALFMSFGESSLDFCLRVFVKGYREHASVAHEIHKAIDREFKTHGIEISFPQRDLHLDSKPITVNLVDPSKGKKRQ